MFFRNVRPYALAKGFAMSPGTLEEQLAKLPLQPPTGMSILSRGWVPPYEDAGLVYNVNRDYLIALGVESKVLPAATVRKEVKLKAAELERTQGYKAGKKQIRDLAERVTAELLPRAFTKRSVTRAWIDIEARLIVVDACSASKAEELLEHLRNTLGELPVTRLETQMSAGGAMTNWLTAGDAPNQFALDSDCQLNGTGEAAARVRYAHHDLSVKEIREHIAGGKFASHLGLLWKDRVALTLVEPLFVSKIKFLAIEKGEDEGAGISAADQREADFLLVTGELRALLGDLTTALGGLKE